MRFSFDKSGLPSEGLKVNDSLNSYREHLALLLKFGEYKEPESSICLPADKKELENTKKTAEDKGKAPLKALVVIGIGGSDLGARAVYEAFPKISATKLFFFETVGAENKNKLNEFLSLVENSSEFLVILASKSGLTIETIANAEYVLGGIKKNFPEVEKRIIVITDEESPLFKEAGDIGLSVITPPKILPGRFSVFSAYGILPLYLAGFDIEEFLSGAKEMLEKCLAQGSDNPAMQSASFLSYWHKKGRRIHDILFFAPELEYLGKWYRQLLSESIGKSSDVGFTPTVSVGSTDLHSVGQLNLDGPEDKTTLLVGVSDQNKINLPKDREFPNLVPELEGKSFAEIMSAIYVGTKEAYVAKNHPFFEATIESLTLREIGAFMQWKMCEVMYLAKMLEVYAFDQPAVQIYKLNTLNILRKQ